MTQEELKAALEVRFDYSCEKENAVPKFHVNFIIYGGVDVYANTAAEAKKKVYRDQNDRLPYIDAAIYQGLFYVSDIFESSD